MPDGPERERLFFEGKRSVSTYVPYKYHVHRILTDLAWPWVDRFSAPAVLARLVGQYVDIDAEAASEGDRVSRRQFLHASAASERWRAAIRRVQRTAQQPESSSLCVSESPKPASIQSQITDLYSRIVTSHIFDGLYRYDYLARPFKIKPYTADGMPEVSDDFRIWTFELQPRYLLSGRPGLQRAAA